MPRRVGWGCRAESRCMRLVTSTPGWTLHSPTFPTAFPHRRPSPAPAGRRAAHLRSEVGRAPLRRDEGRRNDIPFAESPPDETEIASDLRLLELAPGLQPGTCLQDMSGSSTACCGVLSLQLRSGSLSSQCAPVGP